MMDTNGEGSRLNADYFKWIHGFSRKKTRLEQCFGWVPVRSLDDKAVAASVRVLEDALMHKGLLLRSVRQLVLNWEHCGAVRQKARTWCGLLLARVQEVWPRFRILLFGGLSWTGGPLLRRRGDP